jgi:ABC-type glycerol-3-phosphate transport system substrate-binding protein
MVGYYHTIAYALCTLPEDYSRISDNYYPGCFFAPMPSDGDPVITDGKERYPQRNADMGRYGVNAGSAHAEAAQDFLRFLLSEEGQEKMVFTEQDYVDRGANHNGFFIPINRAAFRGMAERDLERIQESLKEQIPPSDSVLEIGGLVKEAEGAIDEISYIITEKPYHRTIIFEAAKQFFLDQISAEEAARQMSDKVGLYLKEQG